ncbi:testin-like isoform X2 [Lycorma delicatula]
MDWVPPGIPLDLAAEYMQKLPATKLPITGTSGALYRRQQFEKQLPRHDLASGLCHELTPNEVEEFSKYLDRIKSHVVGQGKVEKLKGLVPHQQIAEVATQNLQKPHWSTNLKNVNWTARPYVNASEIPTKTLHDDALSSSSVSSSLQFHKFNFRSPSDFVVSDNRISNAPLHNLNFSNNNNNSSSDNDNNEIENRDYGHEHMMGSNNVNECDKLGSSAQAFTPVTDKITTGKHIAQSSPVPGQKFTSNTLSHLNKVPIPLSQFIKNQSETGGNPSVNYAGVNVISQLPLDALHISDPKQKVHIEHSDAVTLLNPTFSEQLKHKNKDMFHDNTKPKLQTDVSGGGNNLEPVGSNYIQKVASLCQQCYHEIFEGDVVVSIDRAEKTTYWHPQCFVCASCKELLVDLVYFFHKNEVYCGRHYADIVKIPRCFACDELIFVKQYTVAEGENFHIRHFCCLECDVPLAGKEYIPVDNHPVCIDCFNKKYAKVCLTCSKIIAPTDKRVSVKEMHWHATDACFCCSGCRRSLLQSKMVINQQKPYCNRYCVMSTQDDWQ